MTSRMLIFVLAIGLSGAAILSVPTSTVAECVDYEQYLHRKWYFIGPYGFGDMVGQGDYLYALATRIQDGEMLILIFDRSDPSELSHVGTYNAPETTAALAVEGDYLYLTTAYQSMGLFSEFIIVDVSDPISPCTVRGLEIEPYGWALSEGVDAAGDHAYVSVLDVLMGEMRLVVFDVSVPSAAHPVGEVEHTAFGDVLVDGFLAYVATEQTGVVSVISVALPTSPHLLSHFQTGGSPSDLTIQDDLLYVADGSRGLTIVDVSDSFHPEIEGSLQTGGSVFRIDVRDNLAFLVEKTLIVANVADASSPVELGRLTLPDSPVGVDTDASYAYVAAAGSATGEVLGGIHTVEVGRGRSVSTLSQVQLEDSVRDLHVEGATCYVANDDDGLKIVDLSDPTSLNVIGELDTPGYAIGVCASWPYAYLADGRGGLQVIDVEEPWEPTIVGNLEVGPDVVDVILVNDYAMVIGTEKLFVVDISNPSEPEVVNEMWIATPQRLCFWGDLLCVVHTMGYKLIDVSDPVSPATVGNIDSTHPNKAAALSEDFLYGVEIVYPRVGIYDISDPGASYLLSLIQTSLYPTAIDETDGLLYVTSRDLGSYGGLDVIDVSDPALPVMVGNAYFREPLASIAVGVEVVVVGGEDGAVATFPLHCGTAEVGIPRGVTIRPSLHTYPNPSDEMVSIEFELATRGWTRLAVYDASGRLLRELVHSSLLPGTHGANWDGRDSRGEYVSSGVYWIRLHQSRGTTTRRITVIK